ncbi:MAG TPA: hypothetical protein VGV17_08780 [Bosea sp. (in: a-proteobacteria)]|jgi:hypothetical protein|uniref:hypothetical protein n=1 Tax=Bosea sp. (in: a-proteobacteria) TaxID=1871050 RepID=UPI002DDD8618|nr:hypothetical protein [Bosea sp. (in: a-proteobacteria)]HEV2553838.1 hypothetical protein [Bosea sp. (in: a-proteobacteria)]
MGTFSALILRSAPQERVSKDGPVRSGDIWSILRDAAARLLRMRAAGLGVAALAAFAPAVAQAAEPWGIPHEKPVVLKGRVVEALCHLKGVCAPDCGAGKRQLGILEADGRFRLVGKGQVDFAGAAPDLAGFCGREVEADGLLIENPAITLFFAQGVREAGSTAPFTPTERFKTQWEARNGAAPEWWRADPESNAIIAETGPLGIKGLVPKPKP